MKNRTKSNVQVTVKIFIPGPLTGFRGFLRAGQIRGEAEHACLLLKPCSVASDGDRILGIFEAGEKALSAIEDVLIVTRMKFYELSLICTVICDK